MVGDKSTNNPLKTRSKRSGRYINPHGWSHKPDEHSFYRRRKGHRVVLKPIDWTWENALRFGLLSSGTAEFASLI
jgi:hypothetical protein